MIFATFLVSLYLLVVRKPREEQLLSFASIHPMHLTPMLRIGGDVHRHPIYLTPMLRIGGGVGRSPMYGKCTLSAD
jgi:hypothetical protein